MKAYVLLLSLLLFAPHLAIGEEAGQQVHLLQMDPNFPLEDLSAPGRTLHPISKISADKELLPPSVQSTYFLQAGLAPFVKNWNAFDRDRFALRCANQEAQEVADRYEGKIPVEAIQKFQSLWKSYQAEREKK